MLEILRAKTHYMKAVNDDLCVGREGLRRITKTAIHVYDDVFHLVAVWKWAQIILDRFYISRGQNVGNAAVGQGCDDVLEAFAAGISLESIKRNGLREPSGLRKLLDPFFWKLLTLATTL